MRLCKNMTKTDRYALISVFDKTGIVEFARIIQKAGYKIISTGGTAKVLIQNKIEVIPIEKITGNPESFDGRMKTISFQVESGILFDRSKKTHQKEAQDLKIHPIDIVVCNLYPFEQTVNKEGVTLEVAVENIDVGGPTMIRAAAKNFKHVIVVVDPADYDPVSQKLKDKTFSVDYRKKLAAKAFQHVSFYDSQIGSYLSDEQFPKEITLPGRKLLDLRYGENPHQKASVYIQPNIKSAFSNLKKLAGRELSLVNITDINAGLESVRFFKEPAAVVIKHNSPCGIATGTTIKEALENAINADPESAFGGVVVTNKKITIDSARIIEKFKAEGRGNMDVIAAPEIEEKALHLLVSVRKTTGLYSFSDISLPTDKEMNLKWIEGGFILQTPDMDIEEDFINWKIVTEKKPTKKQMEQMKISWKFISRIRSNSIIIMDKNLPMTRGIGSGQTSRIRSAQIAITQAGRFAEGAVLASDSFFPFDDTVKLAAKAGIAAIVQQGGSINDKASIIAADKAGISMVFTGRRAFWH